MKITLPKFNKPNLGSIDLRNIAIVGSVVVVVMLAGALMYQQIRREFNVNENIVAEPVVVETSESSMSAMPSATATPSATPRITPRVRTATPSATPE